MANYLILPNSGIEFASREDFLTYCRQVVVSELDPSSFMSRYYFMPRPFYAKFTNGNT